MPMDDAMSQATVPGTESLASKAPEIWEMMLGLALVPADGPVDFGDERTTTGLITIAGDWSGAITLQCTSAAARRFAAAMFAADDPDDLPFEEVRDAHAELTNMTGGGFKNLLEGNCKLGLPTVTEGRGYSVVLPRTRPVRELTYAAGDALVAVTVYERVQPA